MVFDVRYQIVTLAAVFLALGLGVLIGSALVGNDALIEQQVKLIDRLEQDFAVARAERGELQARLAAAELKLKAAAEFQRAVFPALTGGRLAGKKVALVRTGDSLDRHAQEEIARVLKEAGATVKSVTVVARSLELTGADPRDEVLSCLGIPDGASVNMGAALAGAIAREVVTGTTPLVLEGLERLGYLTYSGRYDGGADVVVVLSGGAAESSPQARSVDAPLADALRSLNVTVVGCEASAARTSCIKVYREVGVATVDNADSPSGQLALVLAAAGARGSFGSKETAKELVPDIWNADQVPALSSAAGGTGWASGGAGRR